MNWTLRTARLRAGWNSANPRNYKAVSRGGTAAPFRKRRKGTTMKYFMADTPFAALERMMMDPSRRCDSGKLKVCRKKKQLLPRGGAERSANEPCD